jgi:photosystem II stability/assembly factor-like uncharacterized protein
LQETLVPELSGQRVVHEAEASAPLDAPGSGVWSEAKRRPYHVAMKGRRRLVACAALSMAICPISGTQAVASIKHGIEIPDNAMTAQYGIAVDGAKGLIVVNGEGVFLTRDEAAHWTRITPELIVGWEEHVVKVDVIGDRVWLDMEGASVWDFVPYSWDDGLTWRMFRFPDCSFVSGLTFANSNYGTATVTTCGGMTSLWDTTDGGASWNISSSKVPATGPSDGTPVTPKGTLPQGLTFRSALSAGRGLIWARAWGPSRGKSTPTYLLRSTNNATTWSWVLS